jgi:hypothetical protein
VQACRILWKTPIHAMARYANSYEDRLRGEIRDAIAIGPIASIAQITERLNKRLTTRSTHATSRSCAIR